MAKTKTVHRCSECGTESFQWAGRCGGCGGWNTLSQVTDVSVIRNSGPIDLVSVSETELSAPARSTGISEVDRVLGGGLVDGSVTLLGGEPGIGKSTLALQMASAASSCLYVSGEESAQQVSGRAARLGVTVDRLKLLTETHVETVCSAIEQERPRLVIVDSVQTLSSDAVDSAPGTVSQVRESASRLVAAAKRANVAIVMVGHVTKEGSLAGPRTLEHVVDTVLEFEGDRHHELRMLRAVKHRFGATGEVGVMEMTETGLAGVPDASGMFLDDRRPGISGSVVVPTLQGRRPMLVEVQALVLTATNPAQPRRVAQGIDTSRLAVVLAVLTKRARFSISGTDVYTSVIGGVRIDDPGADLGLALAIASSTTDKALDPELVAVGELGLGGEVRRVSNLTKRLTEAARLGFRRAVVPAGTTNGPKGLELLPVATLSHAISAVRAGS